MSASNENITILCRCSDTDTLPKTTLKNITEGLIKEGISFLDIADLCGAAAVNDSILNHIRSAGNVTIIACYPRAVEWVLKTAGIEFDKEKVRLLNMRDESALDIIKTVKSLPGKGGPAERIDNGSQEWLPWFPVIDYDRCTSCKQCHSFCLFGVYEITDEDKVKVVAPANCKTHCPACARICPEAAIMFPKIDEAPINGSEITDEDATKAKIKVNIDEILGDNIYDALAARRAKAKKRLLRAKAQKQAEDERDACSVNCNRECEKKVKE